MLSWLISTFTTVVLVMGFISWFGWFVIQIAAMKRGRTLSTQLAFRNTWYQMSHRKLATTALTLYVSNAALGAFAHGLVRGRIGGTHGASFSIHLPAAVVLLAAMLVMRFWKNGKDNPRTHRWLALAVLLSFPVVAATSFILWCSLWQS